jgi:uncharacterized membrane protein
MPFARLRLVALLGFALVACNGGKPSGSTCPPGSTLTYQSFGQQFMNDYCGRCHSAIFTGAQRQKAPDGVDFDTVEMIREQLDDIDTISAAGPDATNTEMPPDTPAPTEEERLKLGEWLACGAP